jgi:hypothetical protein
VKHWHTLQGKEGRTTAQAVHGGKAEFQHLVIKRAAKSEVRHRADDQRVVRLHFQLSFNYGNKTETVSVVSEPVFSTELRIERVSHNSSPAQGLSSMIVLCTKVRYKTVAMLITDPARYPENLGFDTSTGWFLNDGRQPSFYIATQDLETHHQFAVIIKVPPFWSATFSERRSVQLRLLDTADDVDSPPVTFDYLPTHPIPEPPRLSDLPGLSAASASYANGGGGRTDPSAVAIGKLLAVDSHAHAVQQFVGLDEMNGTAPTQMSGYPPPHTHYRPH